MAFILDPRFDANLFVADWALCRVMLSREARFPWLVLVPRKADRSELFDLDPADRAVLDEEIVRASKGLKTIANADKINVAALGNVVSQLHIHVIARHKRDAAWPGSPWLPGDMQVYPPGAAEAFVKTLQTRL